MTRKELDMIDDLLVDLISYYNQRCYYEHCSLEQLTEAEDKVHEARAVISREIGELDNDGE